MNTKERPTDGSLHEPVMRDAKGYTGQGLSTITTAVGSSNSSPKRPFAEDARVTPESHSWIREVLGAEGRGLTWPDQSKICHRNGAEWNARMGQGLEWQFIGLHLKPTSDGQAQGIVGNKNDTEGREERSVEC